MKGEPARQARDIALVDAIDAFARTAFSGTLWRVCREGRDPLPGSPSRSRWCRGDFDILYTSSTREGAVAEIFAFLNMQPVFPSTLRYFAHAVRVKLTNTLKIADLPALDRLGVDITRYRERNYARTQEIADAAYFLGFDGLIAPSARSACMNVMLFTDRLADGDLTLETSEPEPVDWQAWQKARARLTPRDNSQPATPSPPPPPAGAPDPAGGTGGGRRP